MAKPFSVFSLFLLESNNSINRNKHFDSIQYIVLKWPKDVILRNEFTLSETKNAYNSLTSSLTKSLTKVLHQEQEKEKEDESDAYNGWKHNYVTDVHSRLKVWKHFLKIDISKITC